MFFVNTETRRPFYLLFFFSLFLSCEKAAETSSPPNIIFMMADDHTSQAWGIYGGVL